MKKLSIRAKITLWFSALLLLIAALCFAVILSVSNKVMNRTVEDSLIKAVEGNADEIDFAASGDGGRCVPYSGGVLRIGGGFHALTNGVYTALYRGDGSLLYGKNPIAGKLAGLGFSDGKLRKHTASGTVWYVFDSSLVREGTEGLWLRGVVSSESEAAQFSSIARVSLFLMPLLLLISVFGGYLIAGRLLRPMKQIAETASHIGRGQDLKRRIDIGEGDDEVHSLAASFNEMFARLEDSFEAERQFTSDASHELRTPTSVITAQCEYTLEQERSREEYRDALKVIRRQGGKMARLIDDMLTFTRLERKVDSFKFEDVDLSRLVVSLSADMALLRDRDISLCCEAEPDIRVSGNAELLSRLLSNLINNAYRYGREKGRIDVSLKSEGAEAVLVVADDGIGISDEDKKHIFRRFYQTESARVGGTGLGLSMVWEIARIHGGSVAVESAVGKGSKFYFRIKKVSQR